MAKNDAELLKIDSSSDGSKKVTYFDMLTTDAISAVLRKLSMRPRSSKWKAFVDPEDILPILQTTGTLSAVARSLFSGLAVRNVLREGFDLCVTDVREGGYSLFERVLSKLGPTLELLNINTTVYPDVPVYHVAGRCTNLRTLILHDPALKFDLFAVLAANSGQLLMLDISRFYLAGDCVAAIAEHCVGLKKLTLKCDYICCSLKPVCRALGPTLESLSMGTPLISPNPQEVTIETISESSDSSSHVARFCKMITHIGSFDSQLRGFSCHVIEAFGSQLRSVQMTTENSCLKPEELEGVKVACPFVMFDVFVQNEIAGTLRVLGDRVRVLKVRGRDTGAPFYNMGEIHIEDAEAEEIRGAAKLCSAIEAFSLSDTNGAPAEFLSIYLSGSKPRLCKIFLDLSNTYVCYRSAMDELAQVASSIEEINIKGGALTEKAFEKFFCSNPQLQYINVACDFEFGPDEDPVLSFIEDASQCSQLREIVLREIVLDSYIIGTLSERIAQACHGLRKIGADIFVNNFQFNS